MEVIDAVYSSPYGRLVLLFVFLWLVFGVAAGFHYKDGTTNAQMGSFLAGRHLKPIGVLLGIIANICWVGMICVIVFWYRSL